MPASRTRDKRRIPWWAYMGWMDDESLAWTYDFYALYGRETWPEELDESINDGQAAQSEGGEQPGDPASLIAAAFGWLARTIGSVASRFRREAPVGAAPAAGGEGGLVLPGSRL